MTSFSKDPMRAFKLWLGRITEECKDISPLFSYALDRKLTLVEKFRIRLHLFTCSACTNYVSNLKFMRDVFHAQDSLLEDQNHQVVLSSDAKERMKKALESAKS